VPPKTLTQQLIDMHTVSTARHDADEIPLHVDQVLITDGTGPTIISELEVMGLDSVRVEVAATYVDHNLLQADFKSADDHEYLRTASKILGMWHSPAGNGIAHVVHFETFGRPGRTLLGADSHTAVGGALGMLAFGVGGLDVALAAGGEPYWIPKPKVWGIEVTGRLPDWVSAKDAVLELLRRHGVSGGAGAVIEYYGPGLASLSIWDRHVMANMGTELGAMTSVFPADAVTREFLEWEGRGEHFIELAAEPGARYDLEDRLDLGGLTPLVAKPHSPGNVVPVEQVAGTPIAQAYLGSSANPGYRDFAVAAMIVAGGRVAEGVSLDVNPSSRQVLSYLAREGYLANFIESGARIHQAGCNGCVGIGQAPASGVSSIRTTPRNFPGRTGTADDHVFLASPETVAASALQGVITDPRSLGSRAPVPNRPARFESPVYLLRPPPRDGDYQIARGPNIKPMPRFDVLPEQLRVSVCLRAGDDISTDEIMPMQQEQLPWRSNIELISESAFSRFEPEYSHRARSKAAADGHCIVAGFNYGQGSAREHAALSPRYLGLRAVLARGFARIHHANLVNFGVVPLLLNSDEDQAALELFDTIVIDGLTSRLRRGERSIPVRNLSTGYELITRHILSRRQIEILLAGGVLEYVRTKAR
jgi:aconitate hydratase